MLCALSGGVDSAVAALLVHRAIGDRLICVFVDNGLLRKDEAAQVRKRFADKLKLKVVFVDASRRFLAEAARASPTRSASARSSAASSSPSSSDAAREDEGLRLPGPGHAVPGRDRVHVGARALGGHQEPSQRGRPARRSSASSWSSRCASCSRTRCARSGCELGLDEEFVHRQPFPGPGLAVRCLGPITRGALDMLREADDIVVREIKAAGLYRADLAVVRGAAAGALGRGDGRRPDVPVRDRHPRGGVGGRHDRGLGAPAPRPAGAHLQRHRERGPRASTAWCTTSPASRRRPSSGSDSPELLAPRSLAPPVRLRSAGHGSPFRNGANWWSQRAFQRTPARLIRLPFVTASGSSLHRRSGTARFGRKQAGLPGAAGFPAASDLPTTRRPKTCSLS